MKTPKSTSPSQMNPGACSRSRSSALAVALGVSLLAVASAQAGQSLNTFYFGNSLSANSEPELQPALAAPTGNSWNVSYHFGAGWQLWQHVWVVRGGVELESGDRGDLTIPEKFQSQAARTRKEFLDKPWDAMVLQPFSQALVREPTTEQWDTQFPEPTDIGDLESAQYLIDQYLGRNPDGSVFIYSNWPDMEPGEIPEVLPDWAVEFQERKGRPVRAAEFPDREAFDYETAWLGRKYLPKNAEQPWLANTRTQDLHYQLFEALKTAYPELWESGRLQMIPAADIWLEIERRAKAGEFPGISTVEDFYTDKQHIRGGLPRYSVAAAFYAVVFGDTNLENLDWDVYNDPDHYQPDPSHDAGEHFSMNPENVAAVNDAIRDTLMEHPYVKGKE